MFIGHGRYREWMKEVFLIDNKVFATDGFALIAMPKDKINTEGVWSGEKTVLGSIYPMKKEFEQVISFSQLSEMMKLVPLVDEVVEKDETAECKECDGSGEVTYLYESKSGRTYEYEYECPICEGTGVIGDIVEIPTGRKIADPKGTCKIKESVFHIKQINRIYEVMKLLGNKDLILCGVNSKGVHLFLIEDVEIIVMPTLNGDCVCFCID